MTRNAEAYQTLTLTRKLDERLALIRHFFGPARAVSPAAVSNVGQCLEGPRKPPRVTFRTEPGPSRNLHAHLPMASGLTPLATVITFPQRNCFEALGIKRYTLFGHR